MHYKYFDHSLTYARPLNMCLSHVWSPQESKRVAQIWSRLKRQRWSNEVVTAATLAAGVSTGCLPQHPWAILITVHILSPKIFQLLPLNQVPYKSSF